jgi:hypothetical protein
VVGLAGYFATVGTYAFVREFEQLHPDNRHVRDNPVNNTGQESASNCKCCEIRVCCCTLSAVAGVCRMGERPNSNRATMDYLVGMNLLLLMVVLLLLFGGGGFYFGGPFIGGGGLGLVLLICLIVFFMGGFRPRSS